MKIVCPLDNKEEVLDLINAGADEFYCGFVSDEWIKKFSVMASANRREWGDCNFRSIEDLKQTLKICKKHDKPVFYCLNSANISKNQYDLLFKEHEKIKMLGFSDYIISDVALMLKFSKFHVSCGAAALNSNAIQFFKKNGATRIILPRQITLEEFKTLRQKNKNVELEAFILNDACKNLDGLCTFMHGFSKSYCKETVACCMDYDVEIKTNDKIKSRTVKRKLKSKLASNKTICGACALHDFYHGGLDAVKIVGRGKSKEQKIKDIKFIKSLLVHTNLSRGEFIKIAKNIRQKTYQTPCTPELCYYEI